MFNNITWDMWKIILGVIGPVIIAFTGLYTVMVTKNKNNLDHDLNIDQITAKTLNDLIIEFRNSLAVKNKENADLRQSYADAVADHRKQIDSWSLEQKSLMKEKYEAENARILMQAELTYVKIKLAACEAQICQLLKTIGS